MDGTDHAMQGEVSDRKSNDMIRHGKTMMGEQKSGVACHIGPAVSKSDMQHYLHSNY